MTDTLIIGVITGTVALLSVGLNVVRMGKTFDHLSAALSQTREQLGKANDQTRDMIKDLAVRMDKQFDRIDKHFDRIEGRFETIESDLKLFYKLQNEQASALQALKERNDLK